MIVLYQHQKEILDLLTQNERFLLLAEVGVGKTAPALINLSNLMLAGEVENALIVAPLSGLGAWTRDAQKLSPERQRLLKKGVTYVNWDKISRKDGKWQKQLFKRWDCIILDEGHAIAKPTSNRTKYFVGVGKALGLASKAKYRYLLTGTLITNSRLEDLWAPLRFILDDEWMTWAEFKRHFLVTKTLPGSYAEMVVGYRNRSELLDIVARYSYRVLKKDCLDLPEEMPDEIVMVPWADGKNPGFDKTTHQLYEDALDSYVEALDMVMDNPLTRRLRISQIAAGHIKESDTIEESGRRVRGDTYHLKSLKTRYALELIENNPGKTVCFYSYRASCESMEKALKGAKIPFVTLNGDQPDKNIWQRFQSDERIRVILVQYQSGSTAIDLFASSSTIYLEPCDSSTLLEQSRARTHRNGQTQPCSYTFLLTEGSVEIEKYKRMCQHQDFDEAAWLEVAAARRRQREGRGK